MKYYMYHVMHILLKEKSRMKSENEEIDDATGKDISSISLFLPAIPITYREELVKRMLYLLSLIESPVDETPSLLVLLVCVING